MSLDDLPVVKRTRGYLPHWERGGGPYFVTFRLADSLPGGVSRPRPSSLEVSEPTSSSEMPGYPMADCEEIDSQLDACQGDCNLRDERLAKRVVDALAHFEGVRYRLHAWCVMPNHVHVVFSILASWGMGIRRRQDGAPERTPLAEVLKSWKSFTSLEANAILGRTGAFWQKEYYDHLVRSERELYHAVEYTRQNPVKAGLCRDWKEWPWSGVGLLDIEKLEKLLLEWH